MPDDIPYPFIAKKITIGGHALSYLDEGQGPVIVMLHGNPTWSFYYRNLVAHLGGQYRLIVPDHMGCGNSDKPQEYPYTLKTHIDNLEQLLHELNVEKFSLVVHDWGGAIGMGLAARQPLRIESLVILNTAAFLLPGFPCASASAGFRSSATYLYAASMVSPVQPSVWPYQNRCPRMWPKGT